MQKLQRAYIEVWESKLLYRMLSWLSNRVSYTFYYKGFKFKLPFQHSNLLHSKSPLYWELFFKPIKFNEIQKNKNTSKSSNRNWGSYTIQLDNGAPLLFKYKF